MGEVKFILSAFHVELSFKADIICFRTCARNLFKNPFSSNLKNKHPMNNKLLNTGTVNDKSCNTVYHEYILLRISSLSVPVFCEVNKSFFNLLTSMVGVLLLWRSNKPRLESVILKIENDEVHNKCHRCVSRTRFIVNENNFFFFFK